MEDEHNVSLFNEPSNRSAVSKRKRKPLRRDVSLERALSKLGYTSRSQAGNLIVSGRVRVNGKIIRDLSYFCSLSADVISVDGRSLRKKQFIYLIMNKPIGVVTTHADELGRKTVYDILGDVGKWIFPVGRLDKDTSGLLLLTNDNRLGERLTNPLSKVPKTYIVTVDKPMDLNALKSFLGGMMLDGKKLMPAKVKMLGKEKFEVTILEGKNRQIRRMCESLDYEVVCLMRISVGNLKIGNLLPGEWRYLTQREVDLLSENGFIEANSI
jgi:23S rRNA pseudouridine2605 synthase